MTRLLSLTFLLALAAAGCATSFTGDAHYPGGAGQCYQDCQAQRMVMAGFVTMGEYSSGCVCAPAAQPGVPAPQAADGTNIAVAAAPAAVGVVLQMRAQSSNNNSIIVR